MMTRWFVGTYVHRAGVLLALCGLWLPLRVAARAAHAAPSHVVPSLADSLLLPRVVSVFRCLASYWIGLRCANLRERVCASREGRMVSLNAFVAAYSRV